MESFLGSIAPGVMLLNSNKENNYNGDDEKLDVLYANSGILSILGIGKPKTK